MQAVSLARCLLFTPADRPERFAKAPPAGADGAVLDLEDGVGLPHKDAARKNILDFFAKPAEAPAAFLWALRINHVSTQAGLRDLLALRDAAVRPKVVVLPKTEAVAEVEITVRHLAGPDGPPQIIATLESGRGLSAAEEIAAHPAVVAMFFGGGDLSADLGATLTWEPMLFARSRVVQAAATAAKTAIDMPYTHIHDMDGLRKQTEASKALGYTCVCAIHPVQIATINEVLTPSQEQLAGAQRIVEAFDEAHGGAVAVDGQMVDAPVVKSAQRIVALAGHNNAA